MIRLMLTFLLSFAAYASDVYMVESKVQRDLENGLSHLMAPNQYLVQVTAEVNMVTERRVTEGETLRAPQEPKAPQFTPMPGFVPEPNFEEKAAAPPERQFYRMVEQPVLGAVRAYVTFDEAVAPNIVDKAKYLVQSYLSTHYPNKARIAFGQLPMLKPKEAEPTRDLAAAPSPTPAATPDPRKSEAELRGEFEEQRRKEQEQLFKYLMIGCGVVILFLIFLVMQRQNARPRAVAKPATPPLQPQQPPYQPPPPQPQPTPIVVPVPMPNPWEMYKPPAPQTPPAPELKADEEQKDDVDKAEDEVSEELAEPVKKDPAQEKARLLTKFMGKSEAFRGYYGGLPQDAQEEIYSILKSPLLDGLIETLELYKPVGNLAESNNPEETVEKHHKDFDDFVRAHEWKRRQFFGFLGTLSQEQLFTLVNHEPPFAVCMMLRFLKPTQSATILDALDPVRRAQIIEQIPAVQVAAFSDILKVEKEIRGAVELMPRHLYGSPKEDVDFWGSVLSESQQQDALLKDLEKNQPTLYPKLKKYKFRLEDAATLTDGTLQKILGDVENDELGLALATCPKEVTDVFLEALSPKRRDVLEAQLVSAKNAPAEQTLAARSTLTKRFREVMG